MKRLNRLYALFCVLVVLVAATFMHSYEVIGAPQPAERIVTVGDVHGHFEGLVRILQQVGLVDANQRWIGGKATFVQTGDLLDRGPHVRKVLDLLISLENQAKKAGGQVIVLLGNHEAMNLLGFFSYVSPEAVSVFGDNRSEKKRQDAWVKWSKFFGQTSSEDGDTLEAQQAEWLAKHPPGLLEYQEALGPQKKYGRWLRQLPIVVQVADTIFVHGGIGLQDTAVSIQNMNDTARQELTNFDNARDFLTRQGFAHPFFNANEMATIVRAALAALEGENAPRTVIKNRKKLEEILRHFQGLNDQWILLRENGPLWYQGYDCWPDDDLASFLPDWLAARGARRIVVSHTPQTDGMIRTRLNNSIFLIDTGMLKRVYHGRASALEIHAGTVRAIYEDGATVTLEPPESPLTPQSTWTGPDGTPLPFHTEAQIKEFLSTASVVRSKVIFTGVNKPYKLALEKDGIRVNAIFRHQTGVKGRERIAGYTGLSRYFRDSYINELAAYEINLMLGMHNIPPTVKRKIKGKVGTVQLWIEPAMTDKERNRKKLLPPDKRSWNRSFHDMRVFDNLINNTDRNQENILIDPHWKIWLIDHTRSFARDTDLPFPKEIKRCSRRLFDVFRNIDETEIRSCLSSYLLQSEVEAFLKRRMKLIDLIQDLIQEKGESEILF